MSYVFGPVPSRRLGRSLGVDLVPFKTCTYDCIYCQLGRTTNKTLQRRQWVPLEDVVVELKEKLSSRPDYVTLSGSGEPTLERMLDGLIAFRNEYHGEYWLEVFLLAGYTAIPAEAHKLAECVRKIKPDRLQLNTVTRPPAEDYAMAVDKQRLGELAALFEPPGEVIAAFHGVDARSDFAATRMIVFEMLQRRPCSIDDIAGGLGMHPNEVVKYVEQLRAARRVEGRWSGGKLYLAARKGEPNGGI